MIVYPLTGYDSFISEADADTYFATRYNADAWTGTGKEAALITAFRSISELDIEIDPDEADQVQAVKYAQCEQALWEMQHDLDALKLDSLDLGGLVKVKLPKNQESHPRYSPRALAMLRPYMHAHTMSRTR